MCVNDGIAIHEAAHILYAARAGSRKMILHAAQQRNGHKYDAIVEPIYEHTIARPSLLDAARYYACGGVATRLLTGDSTGGDGSDLATLLNNAVRMPGFDPKLAEPLWEVVKQDVERELSIPEIWQLLKRLADTVHKKLEQAARSPKLQVIFSVSDSEEVPLLLQLLDRNTKPL